MRTPPSPIFERFGITIYRADMMDVLPLIDAREVALCIADPPYGISRHKQKNGVGDGKLFAPNGRAGRVLARAVPRAMVGDDCAFDPFPLLRFRQVVLFGANYCSHRLPPSSGWLIWDKRPGLKPNDFADCEMAWTNMKFAPRILRVLWSGLTRVSEPDDPSRGRRRHHPTQKPTRLMELLIERFTQPGDLILDPCCGSGPVLLAARRLGRRSIGIEIDKDFAATAVRRLEAIKEA